MVKVRHEYNIIFDLDGTLVHTAPALAKAANYLLRELKLPEISTNVYSTFIGGGIKKQVQRLLNHFEFSYSNIDKYEKRFKDFYYSDPYFQTYLFPNVKNSLTKLKSLNFNIAICTQKNREPALRILDHFKIKEFFTGFAFGDSLEVLKPDPLMVKLATKNFSPKKNIYIGDSKTDLKTARNSDSIFILFTEGYRKENISELKPDYYFSNYRNLLELIKII
tara:strand:+ start:365 stop:1027 length:663 start_codon:yes stop_codon:yes gene_type:complete